MMYTKGYKILGNLMNLLDRLKIKGTGPMYWSNWGDFIEKYGVVNR